MTKVQELAQFVTSRRYENLSGEAVTALKVRVLDSLGCALGARKGLPIQRIREQIDDFGGKPLCSLIEGGRTSPDRAAFYNSALVRYLDFNDSYLAPGETCHPSDNIGSLLAAAQYSDRSGKDFLTAMGIAYQVQCRLSDVAPVRQKGFDHTVQGSYSVAAGASYALGLDAGQTANAMAIAGTAYNALRVTRTGKLSNWKGLAFPSTGWTSTHAAFLAMHGITGPEEVFEGNKGFEDAIAGPFFIDWATEDLERVVRTIVKKYNAEIHSQATLEGLSELRARCGLDAAEISAVYLNTFDVAYNIIGGGEEGGKKQIHSKEEADHSLPYMMAAMLLDGNVWPAQYLSQRILRSDIQSLLQKIHVREKKAYSARFPAEMACDIRIEFKDGKSVEIEKRDYEGFTTRPATWDGVIQKFRLLGGTDRIIDVVHDLERHPINLLCTLLENIS